MLRKLLVPLIATLAFAGCRAHAHVGPVGAGAAVATTH